MRMIAESVLRDSNRVTTIMHEHLGIAEALRDADLQRAMDAVRTHLASTVRACASPATRCCRSAAMDHRESLNGRGRQPRPQLDRPVYGSRRAAAPSSPEPPSRATH